MTMNGGTANKWFGRRCVWSVDPNAMKANTRLRTVGTKILLEASLKVGIRRYIQQSITMAYPNHGDNWITEDMPLDASPERTGICAPVITMEQMIRNIPLEDLEWCILRGGTFVGEGTFQENAIERLRSGEEIVPCDGRNFTSLIHVEELAEPCRTVYALLGSDQAIAGYSIYFLHALHDVPDNFLLICCG